MQFDVTAWVATNVGKLKSAVDDGFFQLGLLLGHIRLIVPRLSNARDPVGRSAVGDGRADPLEWIGGSRKYQSDHQA